MVNGKAAIPKELVKSLSQAKPRLNPDWLMNGDGEMFLGKKYEVPEVEMRVVGEESIALKRTPLRDLEMLLDEILTNQQKMEKTVAAQAARITELEATVARQNGEKKEN